MGLDQNQAQTKEKPLNEVCILNAPTIVVTIEAGVGNKTIPMLLLESHIQGQIKNWSSQVFY